MTKAQRNKGHDESKGAASKGNFSVALLWNTVACASSHYLHSRSRDEMTQAPRVLGADIRSSKGQWPSYGPLCLYGKTEGAEIAHRRH